MSNAVKIVMVEDDHGHAKLIEKNIRRANISNEIVHFDRRPAGAGLSVHAKRSGQRADADPAGSEPAGHVAAPTSWPRSSRTSGCKRAPVVVLTTTDDKTEIQRCYDLGCNVYITKPVDYESFAGAIRQLGLFLSVMQAPEIE